MLKFVWYDPWNMGDRTEYGFQTNKYYVRVGLNFAD